MIAAGGTAGHVVPALAVANALRLAGANIVFIGGSRAEAELVPAAGYPLHTLTVRGLSRRNPLAALRALGAAARAFLRSCALLRTLRPDAVMGAGGYVSGPVGLAAVVLRIPLVLTEADSHLGLANRALAPFARRVCLAFPLDAGHGVGGGAGTGVEGGLRTDAEAGVEAGVVDVEAGAGRAGAEAAVGAGAGGAVGAGAGGAAGVGVEGGVVGVGDTGRTDAGGAARVGTAGTVGARAWGKVGKGAGGIGRVRKSNNRYKVTGRPIFLSGVNRARVRARARSTDQETYVLVFGGSLGARSINLAALDAYAGAGFHVLHVSGRRDYRELNTRALPPHYDLREYLDLPDFGDALAACNLVVARAGGSIFEIAAAGRPAILVPYPHATADHQTTNAAWMARAGAAVVIPDDELDGPRLARETAALLGDPSRLRAMAAASAALGRPDAARDVAAELLEAAGAGDIGGQRAGTEVPEEERPIPRGEDAGKEDREVDRTARGEAELDEDGVQRAPEKKRG